MRLCLYIFVFLVLVPNIRAQNAAAVSEQWMADFFEQYAAENDEDVDFNSFYDELMTVAQNPININQTHREQLQLLPFLNDIQIENILAYIYQNGSLRTIYELQLIEGLDMTDIRRMLPFVVLGTAVEASSKIYLADLSRYGRSELIVRADGGLEPKAGYESKEYQGGAFYQSTKYKYHFKDRIYAGFSAEKDAGEQFLEKNPKGYDFYSVHAQLNNFGKFKTIVLGDFRANFGLGLVLKSGFSMSKSSYVLNVMPRGGGLKKYSSTDEYNFFRGGGATVKIGKTELSAFYSNKMIDGDTSNGSFASIYKSGLHRTFSEMNKRETVNQQSMGGNVTHNFYNLQVGLTLVNTSFNTPLEPDKSVYNYFYFSGKKQTTGGVFYRMRWQKLNLFGEMAMTDNLAFSTINGVLFSPISQVSLVAVQRYYAPEYDTFFASSFSESSRINNENGFYIGAEIKPFKFWKFSVYADSYRFPWPKYGVDAPSFGKDYFIQADYSAKRNLNMFWRIKYEAKQTNISGSESTFTPLTFHRKTSARYQLSYSVGDFTFKNLLECNLVSPQFSPWTYGVVALQDIGFDSPSVPLKANIRFQFFDALDYDNRLYVYENDILYAFAIPMYYGLGSRYYLNLKYEWNENLSLWFKIAQTVYADDRESLSSGNEMIIGNRKTDCRILIKWNF